MFFFNFHKHYDNFHYFFSLLEKCSHYKKSILKNQKKICIKNHFEFCLKLNLENFCIKNMGVELFVLKKFVLKMWRLKN